MGVNKEQKHLPVPKLALSAKNKSRNGCKSIPTNFEDIVGPSRAKNEPVGPKNRVQLKFLINQNY